MVARGLLVTLIMLWGVVSASVAPQLSSADELLSQIENLKLVKTLDADFNSFDKVFEANAEVIRLGVSEHFPDRIPEFNEVCKMGRLLFAQQKMRSFDYTYLHLMLADLLSPERDGLHPLNEVRRAYIDTDPKGMAERDVMWLCAKNACLMLPVVTQGSGFPIATLGRAYHERIALIELPLAKKAYQVDDCPFYRDLYKAKKQFARFYIMPTASNSKGRATEYAFFSCKDRVETMYAIGDKIWSQVISLEGQERQVDMLLWCLLFDKDYAYLRCIDSAPVTFVNLQANFIKNIKQQFGYSMTSAQQYFEGECKTNFPNARIVSDWDLIDSIYVNDARPQLRLELSIDNYTTYEPMLTFNEKKLQCTELQHLFEEVGICVSLEKDGKFSAAGLLEALLKSGDTFFKKYTPLFNVK